MNVYINKPKNKKERKRAHHLPGFMCCIINNSKQLHVIIGNHSHINQIHKIDLFCYWDRLCLATGQI